MHKEHLANVNFYLSIFYTDMWNFCVTIVIFCHLFVSGSKDHEMVQNGFESSSYYYCYFISRDNINSLSTMSVKADVLKTPI